MKIKVGARCNGMNEPIEENYTVDDGTPESELDEMAREHGYQVTGYEHWFEIIKDAPENIGTAGHQPTAPACKPKAGQQA